MIILKLMLWMMIGFCVIYVVIIVHLVRATMKGYDAMGWWKRNSPPLFGSSDHVSQTTLGLMIWPIRLYEFISSIPQYYEEYELKQ